MSGLWLQYVILAVVQLSAVVLEFQSAWALEACSHGLSSRGMWDLRLLTRIEPRIPGIEGGFFNHARTTKEVPGSPECLGNETKRFQNLMIVDRK